MNKRSIVAILVTAFFSVPSFAVSMDELWEMMKTQQDFSSEKSMLSLEYCLSKGISDWGYPTIVHGEKTVEIYGAGIIKILDNGVNREIKSKSRKIYDDRLRGAIEKCL